LAITLIIASGLALLYKASMLSVIGRHVVNTRTLLSELSVVYNSPDWKKAYAVEFVNREEWERRRLGRREGEERRREEGVKKFYGHFWTNLG
jgi:hypothetical protein